MNNIKHVHSKQNGQRAKMRTGIDSVLAKLLNKMQLIRNEKYFLDQPKNW